MSSSVVTVNPQEPQKTVVILMNNDNSSIPITPQTVQSLLVTPESQLPSNVKILSSEDSRSTTRPHQEATSIRVVRIGGADDDEEDDDEECDVTDPPTPKVNLTVHSVQQTEHQPITLQETVIETPQSVVIETPQAVVIEPPQAVPEPVDPTPPPISMEELLADISMDHCYSAVPPPGMLRAQQQQQQQQQQSQQQHGTYTHSTQPMAPELPEDFMASDEDDEDRNKKEEEKPSIDLSPKSDLQTQTKSYLQIDNMNNDLRNGLSIQNQKRRASEDSKKRLSQDHKPKPPPKQIAQSSKEKSTTAKVSRRDSRKSSSTDQDIFSSVQDIKKPFEKERKLQVKIESPKQMAKRKPKVEVKEKLVKKEKKPVKSVEPKKKILPQSKEEMDKKKRTKKEEPEVTEDEDSSEDSDDDSEEEDDDDDDEEEEEGEDDDPEKLWCICRKPHNNRFMICCDKCEDWFHGKCVGVSQATGRKMEETGEQWFCPNCRKDDKQRDKDEKEQDQRRRREKKGDSGGIDPPSRKDDGGGSTRRGRKSTEEPSPQNSSKKGGKNIKGVTNESSIEKKENASNKRKAGDSNENEVSKRKPRTTEEKGKGLQDSEAYGQESARRKIRRGVQEEVSSKTEDEDTSGNKRKKNEPTNKEQEKGRSKLGMVVSCVCGCGQDSQPDWVYFNEECIVRYANYAIKGIAAVKSKGDMKVVVIERKSGQTLSGLPAPTTGNLVKWLQQHPSFEAIIPEVLPTNKFYKSVQPTKNQKLVKTKSTRSDAINFSDNKHPAVIPLAATTVSEDTPNVKTRTKEKEAPVSVSNMGKGKKDISFAEALTSSNPKEAKDKNVKTVVKTAETVNKKEKAPAKAKQPSEVTTRRGSVTKTEAKGSESPKKVNLRTRGATIKDTSAASKEKEEKETSKTKARERQNSTSSGPQRRKSSTSSAAPTTPVEEKKGGLSSTSTIRDTVKKQLLDNLLQRVKDAGEPEGIREEDIEPIVSQIEQELYNIFNKDTGSKYRSKYRSLIFNIKDQKNPLYRDIVEKRLPPERLVRMAPEELAPKELAEWRQRESKAELEKIKKNELDLLQLGNTYVMKTHKGEQVIENEGLSSKKQELEEAKLPDEQPIMSSVVSSAGDEESLNHPNHIFHPSCSLCQEDLKKKANEKDSKSSKKKKTYKKRGKKDKKKVAKKKESEKSKSKSSKKKKDSKKSKSKKKSSKADKETPLVTVIEDSFEEEEEEEEEQPSSTVVIPSPDTGIEMEPVLWRGSINMPDVASLRNVAYQVSGSVEELVEDMPENLNIVGRISSDTVWSYIAKMKKAGNKELIVLRLAPADETERVGYVSLYSYLSSRSRFAVVGDNCRSVKDFYILPLSAHHPIPTVLLPLDGPGFPNERSNLLLGLIVRHRRKRKSDGEDKGVRKSSRLEGSYTPPPHSASFTPPYPSYTPPNSPPPNSPPPPNTPPIYRATRTRKPSSSSSGEDLEGHSLGEVMRVDSLSKRIEQQRKHLESVKTLSCSPEEQSQGISEMMDHLAEPYSPTVRYSPERPVSSPDSTRQQHQMYSPSQTNSYSPTTTTSDMRYHELYNSEKVTRRQSYRKASQVEPYHPEVSYSPSDPYSSETQVDRHHETYSPTPVTRQYSPTTVAQEEAYNQQEAYSSSSSNYRRTRYREDAYSPSQSLTPPPISHPRLPPAPESDVYRGSGNRRFALADDPIVRHFGRERSPVSYQDDLVDRRRAQEYRDYQERYAAYEREAAAYYQTYGRRTRSRAWEETPRREWRPPPAPSPPPPSDWLPGESKKKKKKKKSSNEDREPGELSD